MLNLQSNPKKEVAKIFWRAGKVIIWEEVDVASGVCSASVESWALAPAASFRMIAFTRMGQMQLQLLDLQHTRHTACT